MVRRRLTHRSGLSEIEGIGKARIEKYGEAFVRLLLEAFQPGVSFCPSSISGQRAYMAQTPIPSTSVAKRP